MLGTIINTCTILIGSSCGTLLGRGLKEKYQHALFNGLGLATLMLGCNAALPSMQKSEYPVLFLFSLAIGGLIGTKLDLQGRIDKVAKGAKGGAQGLVTGILLFCIGTFSIV